MKKTNGLMLLFFALLIGCESTEPANDAMLAKDTYTDWAVYLGDKASSHYSPLDQINKKNVHNLSLAWTYRTGDIWNPRFSQIQTNPLIIQGVLYGLTPRLTLFALDAATGQELWRFDPASADSALAEGSDEQSLGVSRGLSFWQEGDDRRLFLGVGPKLLAINAANGELLTGFGRKGVVDIREGLGRDVSSMFVAITTPGVIYKDLLIQGMRVGEGAHSAPGHIQAFDVRTGKQRWIFHTIPQPGELGYDSWPKDAWQRIGGANNWAGMSLDEARGIVYIPTGSAAFDFWGGDRPGKNLFANSLLALEAATGKYRWHFQTVHHDIWDRDLPAPPNLVQVRHQGKQIDAVAQVTKSGFVFVFDRVTGEPLFPIEERPVPASRLVGEETWPTQPFPVKPLPFSRQFLTLDNLRKDDPALITRFGQVRSEGPYVPFDEQGVVLFPGFDGGAEWGGAAASPDGMLYINANEMPWIAKMNPVIQQKNIQTGEQLYIQHCAACHGEDRLGNVQAGYPALEQLALRMTLPQIEILVRQGRGFMPGFAHLGDEPLRGLIAYLRDAPEAEWKIAGKPLKGELLTEEPLEEQVKEALGESAAIPYTFEGYHRFVDSQGNPAVEPPWGTLNALDLNTGEYVWQVPLGDMRDSPLAGTIPTGAENYGGPVVTAGGLIFIAATRDQMFRAFDKDTGQVLWQTQLPAGGYATPAVYAVDGVQYVVIAAGGGKMGTPSGDSYWVFSLPSHQREPLK